MILIMLNAFTYIITIKFNENKLTEISIISFKTRKFIIIFF